MANDALFTNNATSLLAATISNSDTIIQVGSGDGALYPSPTGSQFFMATLEDNAGNIEIVRCTSRTGDLLTCTRGQDNTVALAFTLTITRVELRLVAAIQEEFLQINGGTMTGDVDFDGNSIIDAILSGPLLSIVGGETVGTPMRGATGVSSNELIVPVAPGRATVGGADVLASGDDIVAELDVAGLIDLDSATVGVKIGGATNAYLRIVDSTDTDILEFVLDGTDAFVNITTCDNLVFAGAVVAYTFDNDIDLAGDFLLNDNLLDQPVIQDFSMTLQDIVATATTEIDYELGSYIRLDLNVNITLLNLTNPPAAGVFGALRIRITQNAGGETITWPASVIWPSAAELLLSTGAAEVDFVDLWTDDGGTTWYAAGNNDWS